MGRKLRCRCKAVVLGIFDYGESKKELATNRVGSGDVGWVVRCCWLWWSVIGVLEEEERKGRKKFCVVWLVDVAEVKKPIKFKGKEVSAV